MAAISLENVDRYASVDAGSSTFYEAINARIKNVLAECEVNVLFRERSAREASPDGEFPRETSQVKADKWAIYNGRGGIRARTICPETF